MLERVIQYFYYKVKYTNTTGDIPQFEIEPKYALELLMVFWKKKRKKTEKLIFFCFVLNN